ncbi:hypothetical protein IE4872_PB00118 (plasmid) [Rhizobium gallicum]|uniref:Uncharacterized protein n=2 Tax=Rhizobium gallicum TaxID=56730 RepID=A0A0B4XAE7_9HYPH|nr:hypothetical protein RGR602_PA00152 [Rhizobium gallicum bv. gallicum R602sp]APO69989.1 hypothetical protein IE4872_PB00118 [Rhizobium gallicum]
MLSYQSSSLLPQSQYLPFPDRHLEMHIGEAGDLGAMEPSIHEKDGPFVHQGVASRRREDDDMFAAFT